MPRCHAAILQHACVGMQVIIFIGTLWFFFTVPLPSHACLSHPMPVASHNAKIMPACHSKKPNSNPCQYEGMIMQTMIIIAVCAEHGRPDAQVYASNEFPIGSISAVWNNLNTVANAAPVAGKLCSLLVMLEGLLYVMLTPGSGDAFTHI